MASTHGHGNPKWTRDETILALDFYFDCQGYVPSPSAPLVKKLSDLLRSFPYHSPEARKDSFRNPDGVAFKLQNLRKVLTGRGLGNVSKVDREIISELGNDPKRTKRLANLIRRGISLAQETGSEVGDDEVFAEGRVVTELHLRRERAPRLRQRLLIMRKKAGKLACDICNGKPPAEAGVLGEAMFEAHHVLPLSAGKERETTVKDLACLCANCHRMVHRAISLSKRWLTVEEAKEMIGRGCL